CASDLNCPEHRCEQYPTDAFISDKETLDVMVALSETTSPLTSAADYTRPRVCSVHPAPLHGVYQPCRHPHRQRRGRSSGGGAAAETWRHPLGSTRGLWRGTWLRDSLWQRRRPDHHSSECAWAGDHSPE